MPNHAANFDDESDSLHIVLLDNYDSYTFNLAQLIATLCNGCMPTVVPNDAGESLARVLASLSTPADAIVVSPGPGAPDRASDFGLCAQAYDCGLPVLGVCLGHQGLAVACGGRVVRAPAGPVHGRVAMIQHEDAKRTDGLLHGIPSPFGVVRYHSLVVDEAALPPCLTVTARTADGLVMAMEHTSLPLYGVQFHPESICSDHGETLVANFLSAVRAHRSGAPRPQPALPTVTRHERVFSAVNAPPPSLSLPAPPTAVAATSAASRRYLLVCEPLLHRTPSAEEAFVALCGAAPCAFWLDAAAPRSAASWSYFGCGGGPHSVLLSQHADGLVRRRGLSVGGAGGGSGGAETQSASELLTTPLDQEMRRMLHAWSDASLLQCTVAPDGLSTPRVAPLAAADAFLPQDCAFRGGYVGCLGYEAWHTLGPAAHAAELRERMRRAPAKQPPPPSAPLSPPSYADAEALLLFADRYIAVDHARGGRLLLLCLCEAAGPGAPSSLDSGLRWISRQTRALQRLAAHAPLRPQQLPPARGGPARFTSDRGRSTYLDDIRAISGHLDSGESYEVCLTNAFRCASHTVPPLRLYRQLRTSNPAPHAAYLRIDPSRLGAQLPAEAEGAAAAHANVDVEADADALPCRAPLDALGEGGVAICCSSPERFLRVDAARRVECKPIKGTARRGRTPEEDVAITHALSSGEKERSENLMIVDLIRNDLGRVCSVGSVHVPKLMHVESFASVHQLVSTISGELAPHADALAAVAAAFPPGSMTGAPKCRTMRLIDELERGVPRGAYSGCLGYFSCHGACDLNVVIRTAVVDASGVTVSAGGAIVALSDAADEYEEVLLKARPVLRAVAACVAQGDAEAYLIDDDYAREDWAGSEDVDAARVRLVRRASPSVSSSPLAPLPPSRELATALALSAAPAAAGPRAVELFETMLHTSTGGVTLLHGHLDRLCAAAATLGYSPHDTPPTLRARLAASVVAAAASWPVGEASRVKLRLRSDGAIRVDRAAFAIGSTAGGAPPLMLPAARVGANDESDAVGTAPVEARRRIVLDSRPTSSVDPSVHLKSSSRHVYDAARTRAGCAQLSGGGGCVPDSSSGPPPFDVLMYNEAGEVTECAIANIALEDAPPSTSWSTPLRECGLLPGVLRAELLRQSHGRVRERVITVDELIAAVRAGRRLVGFNALRGVYELELVLPHVATTSAARSREVREGAWVPVQSRL